MEVKEEKELQIEEVETLKKELEELKKELEEAKAQAQENYEKFIRLYAEFDNYRKRVAREKAELVRYGNEELLKELLPVLDNLERALEHAQKEEGKTEPILQGLQLILEQFRSVLRRFGVEEIKTLGERFDPELHEAVGEMELEGIEPQQIVQEVQKGYLLNDRVLRPAKVIVGKTPSHDEETQSTNP
jgi:molecular chaperone GrpE